MANYQTVELSLLTVAALAVALRGLAKAEFERAEDQGISPKAVEYHNRNARDLDELADGLRAVLMDKTEIPSTAALQ